MVAIALDGVTVRYPGEQGAQPYALDELSLEVASGEMLVLAGPSGSGKTTVLRTIAGLEHPERGTVWIGGRVANQLPPGARDVALVSQNESLFPHLNIEQNLGFALEVRKLSPEETARRVRAEARVLGLWSRLRRRPRQLSSGERQKAALGRATTRRPAVYLLDEPLAGLDPGERDRLRRELQQTQRGMGVTTVYVTHDQRDAMALGCRIAVLDRGRLVQVADALEIYERPANLFVARFFGTPPMGLLQGRLHDDGSTAWVDVAGTPVRLLADQRAAVLAAGRPAAVALGFRAPAVALARGSAHPWSRDLDMVVRGVEPLGSATIVALTPAAEHARGTDPLYTLVTPTRRVVRGECQAVSVDMRHALIFDHPDGARLHPRS